MKDFREYLWECLDLERFAVVAIWPQKRKGAVILMKQRHPGEDDLPWAVKYAGAGHYFATIGEAIAYCQERKFVLEIPVS